jgi:hypothetical protein
MAPVIFKLDEQSRNVVLGLSGASVQDPFTVGRQDPVQRMTDHGEGEEISGQENLPDALDTSGGHLVDHSAGKILLLRGVYGTDLL